LTSAVLDTKFADKLKYLGEGIMSGHAVAPTTGKTLESALLAKRSAARKYLTRSVSPTMFLAYATSVVPKHNVVGVGLGRRLEEGRITGDFAIRFYVEKKIMDHAIPPEYSLPSEWNGLPTNVIEAGTFFALPVSVPFAALAPTPAQKKLRPARPGCSIGFQFPPPKHGYLMAGTFGALVTKDDKHFILSNNHVLANENSLPIGSSIFQPGLLDSGNPATDKVAELSDFEPLSPKGANSMDGAIAALSDDHLADGRLLPHVNKLKSGEPLTAAEEMLVMKVGRTTGYTEGEIFDISADVVVQYGLGNISFQDQILIRGTGETPQFSAAGDSGSLIVHRAKRAPVGLLFAGSSAYTIANPIGPVLQRFKVSIIA
jgi:hypothetical protein